MIKITDKKVLFKYISAFAIGDGSLKMGVSNATYRMAQITEHEDYVMWQKSILENITSVNVRYWQPKVGRKQVHIETRQNPKYTIVYNRMYNSGKKVINPHYLHMLDWEYLAIIMMDDGCLVKKYNERYDRLDYSVIMCTESFSYGDNLVLKNAILEKTGLNFKINTITMRPSGNIGYRLVLNKAQTLTFIDNIREFLLPSFQYKADLSVTNRTNSPIRG